MFYANHSAIRRDQLTRERNVVVRWDVRCDTVRYYPLLEEHVSHVDCGCLSCWYLPCELCASVAHCDDVLISFQRMNYGPENVNRRELMRPGCRIWLHFHFSLWRLPLRAHMDQLFTVLYTSFAMCDH